MRNPERRPIGLDRGAAPIPPDAMAPMKLVDAAGLARLCAAGDALAGAAALAAAGLVGWLMRARIDEEHDKADLIGVAARKPTPLRDERNCRPPLDR